MLPFVKLVPLALRTEIVFGNRQIDSAIAMKGRGLLYVDVQDNRGKALLERCGVMQPQVALLWRRFVDILKPSIVLDIGANYGEIGLSCRYHKHSRVYMFEPNPYVLRYLKRSIEAHADRGHIQLFENAVSNQSTEIDFYVDRKWSGTSSAAGAIHDPCNSFKGHGDEHFESIRVPGVTIDQVLPDTTAEQSILFKIDVEGYEQKVLDGMRSVLGRANKIVGIVELNRQTLLEACTEPSDLFKCLRSFGNVFRLRGMHLVKMDDLDSQTNHTDLLVTNLPLELCESRLSFAHVLYP